MKKIFLTLLFLLVPVVNFAAGDCPVVPANSCPQLPDYRTVSNATACGWQIYIDASGQPMLRQTDLLVGQNNNPPPPPANGICVYATSINPWGYGMLCAPGIKCSVNVTKPKARDSN